MKRLRSRFGGLWRHQGFRNFWISQMSAQFGRQIAMLAVPLTAILVLDASPFQMGVLVAALNVPALILGLFAGVWIDRHRRRPVLLGTDLGRAALVAAIPGLVALSLLRMEHLYIISFLFGTLAVASDIAHRSYLPSLISRHDLVEGNSKLELSRSSAEIAGPGFAGGLIQLVTAPFALVVNAATFIISAFFIKRIHAPEPRPEPSDDDTSIWRQISAGVKLVAGTPILRAIGGSFGTLNFFSVVLEAVLLLYLTRQLGLSPLAIGIVFAAGNVGFLAGAFAASRIVARIGVGRTITGALATTGIADLLIPLAGGPAAIVIAILLLAQFLFGLGLTVYNINQVSLRQTVTPDALLGRMNASMLFVTVGIAPVGALIGGTLGELLGLRTTLFVAAAGELLAILWVWFSPMRAMHEYPESSDKASDLAVTS